MAIGLVAGLVLGLTAALTQSPALLAFARWLRPFGTLFLNLLSMVVIPLVATALFQGVAALFLPFTAVSLDQRETLLAGSRGDSSFVQHAAEQIPGGARFIVELIPANPVRAAVEGNLLPLIFFVTIFGVAAAALPDDKRHALTELADVATRALTHVIHWVLLLAPLGIFALVAGAVVQYGSSLVTTMVLFVLAVIVGLALFMAVVYLPAVALLVRLNVGRYLRAIRGSMLMAFSTTSSVATLPVMLEAAETDLKVSRTVASFVLPAGAAVFLTSLTVASVPSASIVSLVPAFAATGLPLAGLSLLLGFDRIPDMFRTTTNVVGHLTGAVVVATVEGEKLE